MEPLPERIILRAPRHQTSIVLFLVFIALSAVIIVIFDDLRAWNFERFLAAGGFLLGLGFCVFVFVADLIRPPALEIRPDGFTRTSSIFGTTKYKWRDLSKIIASWSPYGSTIRLHSNMDRSERNITGWLVWYFTGRRMPTYGMDAESLADLMNKYRDRALAGES